MQEMRRKDRQGTREDAERILRKETFGVLSTAAMEGYPDGVPINYYYEDGCIYIHAARNAGKKIAAMRKDPHVCFTVCTDVKLRPEAFTTRFQSVICFGTAAELEGEAKRKALQGMIRSLTPDFVEAGLAYVDKALDAVSVFCIHIDHMTAKIHD